MAVLKLLLFKLVIILFDYLSSSYYFYFIIIKIALVFLNGSFKIVIIQISNNTI